MVSPAASHSILLHVLILYNSGGLTQLHDYDVLVVDIDPDLQFITTRIGNAKSQAPLPIERSVFSEISIWPLLKVTLLDDQALLHVISQSSRTRAHSSLQTQVHKD